MELGASELVISVARMRKCAVDRSAGRGGGVAPRVERKSLSQAGETGREWRVSSCVASWACRVWTGAGIVADGWPGLVVVMGVVS